MPRRRGGAAPSRPVSAPSRPTAPPPARPAAPTQQQSRQSSTAAAPTQTQQAPPQQASGGSGLFGQMASTAAGVAVGSSIGHAIGGFFGGGSSAQAAPEAQQAPAADYNSYSSNNNAADQGPCAGDVKMFTQCMDQNRGDLNICGWYMDQLKACQQAARGY